MDTLPSDLIAALRAAKKVVVFTGAGVSAESGIPTFRDALTGLWARFDAERLATPEAFQQDPELVWGWYEWRRHKVMQAQPNPAHIAIAELAQRLPGLSVITQNVDDLHERAGLRKVIHLHGSLHAPRCSACGRAHALSFDMQEVEPDEGRRLAPPRCVACQGLVRPGVVWFGEALPRQAFDAAIAAVEQCDLLLSIGTSGLVYPAAEMPGLARRKGAHVVQVNPAASGLDSVSNWHVQGRAGERLPGMLAYIGA
jgi:NAD-dependent deacetylase